MTVKHNIHNNNFWLSYQRCLFWEEQKALIVSDLHIGKSGHFRKSGIAVPQHVFKEDLQRLFAEIQYYKPQQLIIVGDLFHSKENKEMDLFVKWRTDLEYVDVHLIKGNHDIFKNKWYEDASINVHEHSFCINEFLFTHDATAPFCEDKDTTYIFSGHIHPGIIVKGTGRQSLRFPCYYFGAQYAILPAFSKFTGLALVEPKRTDTVYAIVDKSVLQL
ncbi:MAG: ligase-associated DNA damage response endonuclease PdeM [Ilyomonas sp.]